MCAHTRVAELLRKSDCSYFMTPGQLHTNGLTSLFIVAGDTNYKSCTVQCLAEYRAVPVYIRSNLNLCCTGYPE